MTTQEITQTLTTQDFTITPDNAEALIEWCTENGFQDTDTWHAALTRYCVDLHQWTAEQTETVYGRIVHREAGNRIADRREYIRDTIQPFLEGLDTATPEQMAKGAEDAIARFKEINRTSADHTAILQPQVWADVVEDIKSKPEAHETSWLFPTKDGYGERLIFQTRALSIVAAATGHAKTTFLIDLLLDAATRYPDRRHWLFSYEEDAAAVTVKTLNVHANMYISRNNRRSIEAYLRTDSTEYFYENKDTFPATIDTFRPLIESGTINIRDADYTAEDLCDIIRALSHDRPGIVLIDYVGMMNRDDRTSTNARHEELKRIALDLKNVAINTGLAIVAAAQFNREVISPGRMMPQRIAEASDIERAANKVLGLWNGDKPAVCEGHENTPKQRGITAGTMLIEVLKARDERSDLSGVFAYDGNRGTIAHTGEIPGSIEKPTTKKAKKDTPKNGTSPENIQNAFRNHEHQEVDF